MRTPITRRGTRLSPQPPRPSVSGLPDLAWVIRGGTMQTQSLLLAIDKAERQLGSPGISIYAADSPTVAELLVRLGPVFLSHRSVLPELAGCAALASRSNRLANRPTTLCGCPRIGPGLTRYGS